MSPDRPVFEDPERPVPPARQPLPVPDAGQEKRTLTSERREEQDQERRDTE
ncbi:MAG: hypothetical protein ABR511_11080 [Acidimicrobiales bacterium]